MEPRPTTLTHHDNSGWVRDFSPEKFPIWKSFGQKLGISRPTVSKGDDRQTQFFDTSFYFREGGLDLAKVTEHADLLIIQAGIGSRMAATLPEHVRIAKEAGKPYATYLIFDVDDRYSLDDQVNRWFEWPGVAEAPLVNDVEPPRARTRHLSADEVISVQLQIKALSQWPTWIYSRVNILEKLFRTGFPPELSDVLQWIAQYLFDPSGELYRYFPDFLSAWAWRLPPAVQKSPLYVSSRWRSLVKAWQISSKFDGQFYLAPPYTGPGQPGIKDVDGNVSIEPLTTMLTYFPNSEQPPDPPPDPIAHEYRDRLLTLFPGQYLRSEPSAARGMSTVIKSLPLGAVLTVVSADDGPPDTIGMRWWLPGLSAPKDSWAHVVDSDGDVGWVAVTHSSRPTVFVRSIPPEVVPTKKRPLINEKHK